MAVVVTAAVRLPCIAVPLYSRLAAGFKKTIFNPSMFEARCFSLQYACMPSLRVVTYNIKVDSL
jgi:hypothetical protein